jgi:hypothetical protein
MTLQELRGYPRPLISVREAASVLGLPASSCYDSLRNSSFPLSPIRVGRRLYLSRDALVRLIEGASQVQDAQDDAH